MSSNCEELTQGAHFRVAPNNRHGAAERKRPFAFLVPQNCFQFFGNNRERAGRDCAPRAQKRCHGRRLVEAADVLMHEILSQFLPPRVAKTASLFAVGKS
jgi:hypothetical protein